MSTIAMAKTNGRTMGSERLSRLGLLQEPAGYVYGPSLYEYVGSNPGNLVDPSGLAGATPPPTSQPTTQPSPQEIANAFAKKAMVFTEPFEGRRVRAYRDTVGKVTVGVGFNMDAPAAKQIWGKLLPTVDFKKVHDQKLALGNAEIDALFDYTIRVAIDSARKYVSNFDEHPESVQLVVVDMSFQLGSLVRFTKFREALAKKDYCEAAKEMVDSKWAKTDSPNRAKHHIAIVLAAASKPTSMPATQRATTQPAR